MTAGVTRVGADAAGGRVEGGGQSFVRAGGDLLALVGDAVAPHGAAPHSSATLAAGSTVLRIGGTAVVRAGDAATCGHPATGAAWLRAD